MPAKPWVTFRRPDPEGEYIALLSELPLKRFRDLGEFLLYTWQVQNQLRSVPGLVGYSLKARVLTKRFWTLSVWEAEADLRQFVGQVPHSRVMTALGNKMEQTHFLRWSIRGSQYHPSWQEAFERRRAAGLLCSFCRANQAAVEKLIAGPHVYICNRCVHRLVDKLPESARPRSAGPSISQGVFGQFKGYSWFLSFRLRKSRSAGPGTCSFCFRRSNGGTVVLAEREHRVCSDCLGTCVEILRSSSCCVSDM